MNLRYYQQEALNKIKWAQQLEGNDLCVIPTGGGKSLVIAELANALGIDVLILQPSKEILEQNVEKLSQYVPRSEIGIYSASMGEKVIKKYTFATIGSIHKKAEDFAHFKLVIIDECHLVNQKDTGSMFSKFLKAIGNPKVVGFTATPYRNVTGYHKVGNDLIAAVTLKLVNRMRPQFWKRIIYNINNDELTARGYLAPLKYIDSSIVDHYSLKQNKSGSDFDMDDFEAKLTEREDRIVSGLRWANEQHGSILVFCPSVRSAVKLASLVPNSAAVHSGTKPKEREEIINAFKNGSIKIVFNMGVLTTGFDHPALDCIILARPTRSVGLYYQMLGRGVRLAPNKTHCTVIDFTGTVAELGKIESIKLVKEKLWELKTETGDWHNRPLYSYIVPPKEANLFTK
jgi:DNA repair protein RadD